MPSAAETATGRPGTLAATVTAVGGVDTPVQVYGPGFSLIRAGSASRTKTTALTDVGMAQPTAVTASAIV
jgi:hypothetical protein